MREQEVFMASANDRRQQRPYSAPQLIVYGGLADLTAAGSTTPAESNGVNCLNMSNKLNTMCA